MMQQLIETFPGQLKEGIERSNDICFKPHNKSIHNILICGMGGSGIGGDYTAQMVREMAGVPVIVCKSYEIPAWVDGHTLCLVSSYSGNTEESLACLEQVAKTGAKVICITSGGKIESVGVSNHLDIVLLPAGYPSPRACLGYSVAAQLMVLQKAGMISYQCIDQLRIASDLLKFEQEAIKIKAAKIAETLASKIVVLYSTDRYEPVAWRWRQQLNENAKVLAWHHVIPEMNHNEIVGWTQQHQELAVVLMRNKDDYRRNVSRMDFVAKIVSGLAAHTIEIISKGNSYIERAMYLTHLGDWVSLYLAQIRGVDASEIRVIDQLKKLLNDDGFK